MRRELAMLRLEPEFLHRRLHGARQRLHARVAVVAPNPQHPWPISVWKCARSADRNVECLLRGGNPLQRRGDAANLVFRHVSEELQGQVNVVDLHPRNLHADVGALETVLYFAEGGTHLVGKLNSNEGANHSDRLCRINGRRNAKVVIGDSFSPSSCYYSSVSNANPTERFLNLFAQSCADGTFVRLILSSEPKVTVRLVELKGVPHLSLTFHHATNDVTKNIPASDAVAWTRQQLAGGATALLCTTKRDWQLTPHGLVGHKPTVTTAPPRAHDRRKRTFLDDTAQVWLDALSSTPKKRQQIERYLEILSHLLKETTVTSLADMGCGKGYLTFGTWHLFRKCSGSPVRIIGVEARPELVEASNALARKIGAEGLEFVAGTIQSVALPPLDALIALHACDTATDDAIRRGIEMKAKLIVVAPCCHKEVRPQLARPEPLASVLKHGIMAERMAEWATDGLRALHLEAAGYRTKLFEFVSSEHTPKNLMIAAIRTGKPERRKQLERFKEFFGIKHHALD